VRHAKRHTSSDSILQTSISISEQNFYPEKQTKHRKNILSNSVNRKKWQMKYLYIQRNKKKVEIFFGNLKVRTNFAGYF
jgi:hypothetical protein